MLREYSHVLHRKIDGMEGGDSVFGGTLDLTSMVNLNEEKASVVASLLRGKLCQLFLDGAVASHSHPVEPTQ